MNKETSRYIINYYGGLLSELESKAYRHIISLAKLGNRRKNKKLWEVYEKKELISSDPKVLELVKNGSDEFFRNAAKRILKENPEIVFLNNCEKCGMLARTPEARQCRHCGNKWFDKGN
ncbi:hypothetical protein [Aquimarina mytili]|uniref:Uncharacterized protein n=1 Tax=Aquimarina mytili TaxID=874423 RepID=A0A937A6R6_9FLAO|nr:hypothetical protein [Aquimarina mytili]MBL0685895.1 hypothetical protein [Aquimarina mytili]